MRSLRERWHTERPQVLVALGSAAALGGSLVAMIYNALAATTISEFATTAASGGLACLLLLAATAFRVRTPRSFLLVGLLGSAVALLAWPATPGGTLAVLGAVWGLLSAHEATTASKRP